MAAGDVPGRGGRRRPPRSAARPWIRPARRRPAADAVGPAGRAGGRPRLGVRRRCGPWPGARPAGPGALVEPLEPLATAGRRQTAWLKVVPPFFAHEGARLEMLADRHRCRASSRTTDRACSCTRSPATTLRRRPAAANDGVPARRSPGGDGSAGSTSCWRLGLPDWRAAPLAAAIASVVERTADELTPARRATLARFVEGLPSGFAAVARVRAARHAGPRRLPSRATPRLPTRSRCSTGATAASAIRCSTSLRSSTGAPRRASGPRDHWHRAWRAAVPGCESGAGRRAARAGRAARQAVDYRMFLDASSRPSSRTTPPTRPSVCVERRNSSATPRGPTRAIGKTGTARIRSASQSPLYDSFQGRWLRSPDGRTGDPAGSPVRRGCRVTARTGVVPASRHLRRSRVRPIGRPGP